MQSIHCLPHHGSRAQAHPSNHLAAGPALRFQSVKTALLVEHMLLSGDSLSVLAENGVVQGAWPLGSGHDSSNGSGGTSSSSSGSTGRPGRWKACLCSFTTPLGIRSPLTYAWQLSSCAGKAAVSTLSIAKH